MDAVGIRALKKYRESILSREMETGERDLAARRWFNKALRAGAPLLTTREIEMDRERQTALQTHAEQILRKHKQLYYAKGETQTKSFDQVHKVLKKRFSVTDVWLPVKDGEEPVQY